jgi:hypothetical protein
MTRKSLGSIGTLVVLALLIAAVPAQALGRRAGGRSPSVWASAWESLGGFWAAVLARVGIRLESEPPVTPCGEEGSGIDPWGTTKS